MSLCRVWQSIQQLLWTWYPSRDTSDDLMRAPSRMIYVAAEMRCLKRPELEVNFAGKPGKRSTEA